MHGFALAGVTMSVLIRFLSPLVTHGTPQSGGRTGMKSKERVYEHFTVGGNKREERQSGGESQVNSAPHSRACIGLESITT